ncbi:hypothetical protein VI817_005859 [Penicillium citrinum]|nr:hypothetical protein VI817_005859 [Penicillium citrinum]
MAVLIGDCAERGGCHGRDCRCCSARRNIPGRRFAAGHCSTRCHCCEKVCGFVLSVDETKILDEKSKDSRPGYCRQIRKASLLGLIAGNYKDYSIDLIEDVPPAYTAS